MVASGWSAVARDPGKFTLLLASFAAAVPWVIGCSDSDAAHVAKSGQALTATDGSTGVPDCDSYLDQYETCMQAVVPPYQFNQVQTGIKRQRAAWLAMQDTAFKRASLAKICREAADLARREFPTCTWTGNLCGNGVLNVGEQCDDGNQTPGDGCSATCSSEPRCGDGVVNGAEQCDDGNTTSGDGCSATCTTETRCGDGIVNGGEQCDDGNTTSGDGCSATCTTEPRCNDGIRNGTESDVDCGGSCSTKCANGQICTQNNDCTSNLCSSGICSASSGCTAATATDLGAPGTVSTVSKTACLKVQSGYPSWWGTNRSMQFQTQGGGSYPVPFTWSNSCAGGSGSNSFTAAWQTRVFGPTSNLCATVIKLNGTGTGTLGVTYHAQ